MKAKLCFAQKTVSPQLLMTALMTAMTARPRQRRSPSRDTNTQDNTILDPVALQIHQACLDKIAAHPELWQRLKFNLDRLQQQRFLKQAVLNRWQFIIEGCQDIEQLRQAVLVLGRPGMKLRANSIFMGILTEEERLSALQQAPRASQSEASDD